jgi:hypothetical protein
VLINSGEQLLLNSGEINSRSFTFNIINDFERVWLDYHRILTLCNNYI